MSEVLSNNELVPAASSTSIESTEILVVGGGISGLYIAWRLLKEGRNVKLLEASDHFGGRIRSEPIPGTKILAELGAMRFTAEHQFLGQLIDDLDLRSLVRSFDFTRTKGYYLRGKRFSVKKFSKKAPYVDTWSAKRKKNEVTWPRKGKKKKHIIKSPDRLVSHALACTLGDISIRSGVGPATRKNIKELIERQIAVVRKNVLDKDPKFQPGWGLIGKNDWRIIKEHGELNLKFGSRISPIKLKKTGFWNLLEYYLGGEGFQLIHDAMGYESMVSNWSSAEALPWFIADFAVSDYLMLAGGMEQLVNRLEEKLGSIAIKNSKVRKVNFVQSDPGGEGWRVEYESERKKNVIEAERVILAMPRRPLEELVVQVQGKKSTEWQKIRKKYLPAVFPHTLFKVLLVFRDEWWHSERFGGKKNKEAEGERVITDLPIRQVYYYDREWIEKHGKPGALLETFGEKWALLMASYSDSHYVSFWKPFLHKPKNDHKGVLNLDPGHPHYKEFEKLARNYGVPARMVEKLRRQLAEIHRVKIKHIPEPILGLYTDWGNEPGIRAGWHSWEVKRNASKIANRIEEPLENEGKGLYICGEAYSSDQGWIEGALQSAERVLRRLGIRPPGDLTEGDRDF